MRSIPFHCFCYSDSDAIKVYIRVRPPVTHLADVDNSACLEVDKDNRQIRMHCRPEAKVFTFDEVADIDTTQVSHHFPLFLFDGSKINIFN